MQNLLTSRGKSGYFSKIMLNGKYNLREFDFKEVVKADLLIVAGGFERRSCIFAERLRKSRTSINNSLLLQYESQPNDNDPNRIKLESLLEGITKKSPNKVLIHARKPLESSARIRNKISELASHSISQTVLVDISGMTHLWALTTIDACLNSNFSTSVKHPCKIRLRDASL